MARQLEATCNICNFKKEDIYFGASEATFREYRSVPGIDLATGQLVTANWKQRAELKDKILFYTEPELYEGKIIDDIDNPECGLDSINAWDSVLKKFGNKCPSCLNFSLRFEIAKLFSS
jgi:hypothetical protein